MLTGAVEGEAPVGTSISETSLSRSERGASAVEYALLLAGIAAALVLAIFALGPLVVEMFDDTCTKLTNEISTTASCDS
jgi:pilus assembly protein Flp/PilA